MSAAKVALARVLQGSIKLPYRVFYLICSFGKVNFFQNFPEILIVINCLVRKFKLAIPVAAKSQPCLDGNGDLGQARLLRRICGQLVNTCEIFQGEKMSQPFLNYEK